MSRQIIFHNASQVATCAGPARGRRGLEMTDAGVRTDVAIAVDGSIIAALGPFEDMEREFPGAERVDCGGRIVTPGL
ncbi:MAG TPA: hypothetical protein VIC03_00285, partial [Gemmatimonadaceae bacterium]